MNNQLAVPTSVGAVSGFLARNLYTWLVEQSSPAFSTAPAPISHSVVEELLGNCSDPGTDWAEVLTFLRQESEALVPLVIGALACLLLRGIKEVWNGFTLTIAYANRDAETPREEQGYRASAKRLPRSAAYKAEFS